MAMCTFLASGADSNPRLAAHAVLCEPAQRQLEHQLFDSWSLAVAQLLAEAGDIAHGMAGSAGTEAERQLVAAIQRGMEAVERAAAGQQDVLPPACSLAAALLDWWRRPEQEAADQLELAQAAATRSCAYLRCANLGGGGGPAAGQGEGSQRCR